VVLRYLADQLTKVQIVNDVNKVIKTLVIRIFFNLFFMVFSISLLYYVWKDFVIEALRSIAELITYGDQHDPSFFE
jgi:protein CLEC16A